MRPARDWAWLVPLMCLACGPRGPSAIPVSERGDTLRLRHQILYSNRTDTQVFEGYMIRRGEAFIVKAFAGPGVDLFTIARDGARKKSLLHIASLADRFDIEQVGDDIARVSLSGCGLPEERWTGERACDFYGERLEEIRDANGDVRSRYFPAAHGIGLRVTYEEFGAFAGRRLPAVMTLTWGGTVNRMVIRLVEAAVLDEFPIEELDNLLAP